MRGLVVNYYSMFFKYFFLLSCLLYYLFSFLYGSVLEFGIGGGVGGRGWPRAVYHNNDLRAWPHVYIHPGYLYHCHIYF